MGLAGAVDDGDVAVVDAGPDHRVALHTPIEGGLGVLDKVAVEVEAFMQILLGRAGEAGAEFGGQLQLEAGGESALQ